MMASCKDCLHYDVCHIRQKSISLDPMKCGYKCPDFKNKSDFQEVKHGKLNHIVDFGNGICVGYCSHCGTEHRGKNPSLLKYSYKYCRWCGTKLDGGKSE